MRFTALLHHVNVELLRSSYYNLKRQAAAGVDQVTWQEYGDGLEEQLVDLHGRIHRGAYHAKPSRRVWIAKEDGRKRPLGIAALEDKIVQAAVVEVLNQIWEEDFLGFSYGFRRGRSQHEALDALCVGITSKKVNFIFDADVRSFFDEVSQEWLVRFLEHRIGDERVIRALHISEASAAGRPEALLPRLGNLRLGQPQHAALARPGVAADQHRAALVARVERQQLDVAPGLEGFESAARVGNVPAEMPDRTLRLAYRRGVDLGEQHHDLVRRF